MPAVSVCFRVVHAHSWAENIVSATLGQGFREQGDWSGKRGHPPPPNVIPNGKKFLRYGGNKTIISRTGKKTSVFRGFVKNIPNGKTVARITPAEVEMVRTSKLNYRPVKDTVEIGRILRQKRKSQGLTLEQVAQHCGLSIRFISEVERGKATAEFGKVLFLLSEVGVDLYVDTRG
jgi:hypothetical protein